MAGYDVLSDDDENFKPQLMMCKRLSKATGQSFREEEGDDDEQKEAKQMMKKLATIALGNDGAKKVLHNTPSDTWGTMIYVITKDVGDILQGECSFAIALRVAYSSAILALNLVLQFMVLWWSFIHIIIPSVSKFQTEYKAFHRDCFDIDGKFNATKWDNFPADTKHHLCHSGIAQPSFLTAILFLWMLAMLAEFHENLRLHRHLRQMPDLPRHISHAHQVLETECGELEAFLVALSWKTRALIYVLIIIPKYIIIFALTLIGWVWLSAGHLLSDLILNCLALAFVVTIDDVMFVALFPEKVTERVCALKLVVPAKEYKSDEERREAKDWEVRVSVCRSMCILIFGTMMLWIYCQAQIVLPGKENDLTLLCSKNNSLESLPCSLGNYLRRDCFPKGPSGGSVEV